MGLIVRPAAPSDRASLREAAIASWQDAYVGILPDAIVEDAPAMIDRALDKRLLLMRVAVDDLEPGRVLGWYSLGDTAEERGLLWHLYVDPAAHRRGVGRALHEAAIRELSERGVTWATLDVVEGNAKGHAFWTAMGWRATGREKDDDGDWWLIVMERRVP